MTSQTQVEFIFLSKVLLQAIIVPVSDVYIERALQVPELIRSRLKIYSSLSRCLMTLTFANNTEIVTFSNFMPVSGTVSTS